MIEVAGVKELVRDGLCRDCKGTAFGKWESCGMEDLCSGFKEECAEMEREAKALEGVGE